MKITKQALKRIIKEETRRLISEIGPPEHEAFKLDFDAADRVDRAAPRHGRPSERDELEAELGAEPETWRDDLPEEVRDINIVETSSELIPQEHEDDITWTTYDIMLGGKRVGKLEYGDYFGNTDGHLFNRRIDVSRYENKDMIRPAPYGKLVSFLKTETGKKFLASPTVRRFISAGEEAPR